MNVVIVVIFMLLSKPSHKDFLKVRKDAKTLAHMDRISKTMFHCSILNLWKLPDMLTFVIIYCPNPLSECVWGHRMTLKKI